MKYYILGHWRGEHSLRRSILVNAFLVNIFVAGIDWLMKSQITDETSNTVLISHVSITIGYGAIIAVWQVVGIWRSAGRAISIVGIGFGSAAARIYVVFIAFSSAYYIVDLILIDYRLAEQEFGLDREISEFELELLSDAEIALDGGISAASAAALERELKMNGQIEVLSLTSIGGYLKSARRFIKLVQKYELQTYVYWECVSACTDVFLASDVRVIGLEGYLGFHSADCPGLTSADEACAEMQTETEKYYSERGVAGWFVKKISATSNAQMWEPTFKELSDAGVITHIFDGEVDVEANEYCRENDCTLLPVSELEEEEVLSP